MLDDDKEAASCLKICSSLSQAAELVVVMLFSDPFAFEKALKWLLVLDVLSSGNWNTPRRVFDLDPDADTPPVPVLSALGPVRDRDEFVTQSLVHLKAWRMARILGWMKGMLVTTMATKVSRQAHREPSAAPSGPDYRAAVCQFMLRGGV